MPRTASALVAAAALAITAGTSAAQQKPLGTQQPSAATTRPAAAATVVLQFTNTLKQPVDAYLRNPQTGAYQPYGSIAPGTTKSQQSRPGLIWVFGVNKKPIQRYETGTQAFQTVTVGGQAAPAGAGAAAATQGTSGEAGAGTGGLTRPTVLSRGTLATGQASAAPSAQKGKFPAAASWGGVMRSGPGTDTAKLASLKEREPIELLGNTGVVYNGYPWFQIRYKGKTGYHWGGIICGRTQPIPGTYETCP